MPDPLRVAFVAAECEPWAKTGGLGDVTDALARSLPAFRVRPTDSSTSSCRATGPSPVPDGAGSGRRSSASRTRTLAGAVDVSIVDVAGDGYRLRLVDHPAAFDRDGLYGRRRRRLRGQRMAVRAALPGGARGAAGRGRPPGGPPPPPRLARRPDRPVPRPLVRRRSGHRPGGRRSDGPQPRLSRLDAARAAARPGAGAGRRRDRRRRGGRRPPRAGIERSELVNTVSAGFARESLGPEFGFGLDATLRAKGDRYLGILNGLDTTRSGIRRPTPTSRRPTPPTTCPARPPAGPTCWRGSASTRPTTPRSSG